MNDRQLKAYIKSKYGYKVKYIYYGYILLEQVCYGDDYSYWRLKTKYILI